LFIKVAYEFLEYLRAAKNASEHTIRNYSIDLNSLKEHLEEDIFKIPEENRPEKIRYDRDYNERSNLNDQLLPLSKISKHVIRSFLAHLNEETKQRKTVLRRISSLRTFFKYAFSKQYLDKNPIEDIDSPKLEKRLPTSLTYDQVQKLFDQPDTQTYLGFRDRCIMELFYSSGLRVSELVALDRSDFDAKNLVLRLRGKGKKERIVPITKNASDWIAAYLNHAERHLEMEGHLAEIDHEAIFLNKLGTRLTPRSVDRKFRIWLIASGLSARITPHTIRHTIATHWLENDMDLKTIQMLLGHESPTTTTIYTQVSTKLKKETYDKTHPRA
jgi:integrase/recombinase XerC